MLLEDFKKKSANIPDAPGVYFFVGAQKKVLYIGKATSLKSRVRSYFASDLSQTRGPLLVEMLAQAKNVEWRECDSVLEALILEANLIHARQPRYNTLLKDDKSFNYVVITKEDFPRVLLVRGRILEEEFPEKMRLHLFGPFPHGAQLKEALKIVRKIFPYRDTCTPAPVVLAAGKRPKQCFNRHIGLCPGVCSGEITKTDYRKIVRRIALLFSGKKKELLQNLERDMKRAAKAEEFEEAARLRTQVFALGHIQDVSLIKDEYRSPSTTPGGTSLRIEAYDVAHLQGAAAIGVMTVVEDGAAQKSEYRSFHIRTAGAGDDPGALREILLRRFGHDEWRYPRLIVVDGATAQINAAGKVLSELGLSIPIVAVVKDEKHRPREIRGFKELNTIVDERDILLANGEAHRFAIGKHRWQLRQR
jgi:excinuclease ABC subunit C